MANYSIPNLVDLIINQGYNDSTAAREFGVSLKFIQTQQETSAYKRQLRIANARNKGRPASQIPRVARNIAEQEVENAPRASRVENVQHFDVVIGQPQSILRSYEQGNPLLDSFGIKWYLNATDFTNGVEAPQIVIPTNVNFMPATPVQEQGTHLVTVSFTPTTYDGLLGEVFLE